MPLVPAVTLGAVSGMRAMMAPAVISWSARKNGLNIDGGPFSAFKGAGIMKAATALMMGEVVADKMPFMPNRTDPMALATRALSGGAAGMAVFKARRRSVVIGALIGAAAAVGAADGAYHLRKKAAEQFQVSDRTVALIEDGIALTAGLLAVSVLKDRGEVLITEGD